MGEQFRLAYPSAPVHDQEFGLVASKAPTKHRQFACAIKKLHRKILRTMIICGIILPDMRVFTSAPAKLRRSR
jgi:hypothetical protein